VSDYSDPPIRIGTPESRRKHAKTAVDLALLELNRFLGKTTGPGSKDGAGAHIARAAGLIRQNLFDQDNDSPTVRQAYEKRAAQYVDRSASIAWEALGVLEQYDADTADAEQFALLIDVLAMLETPPPD
jgi:hypothetical protein